MKRLFDIMFSLAGLILFFPIFIMIAIAIKFHDNGPIIFTQKRIGQYGKHFILYKFRSMTVLESAKEGVFEPGNTHRITTIGRFIRNTKLDELPQLFNVLTGKMSIVGPRPEIEKWVSLYPERWKRVLVLKPGITDNASILFRSEETLLQECDNPDVFYKDIILPKKLDIYENYVINHSICGDLIIIIKSLHSIILNNK